MFCFANVSPSRRDNVLVFYSGLTQCSSTNHAACLMMRQNLLVNRLVFCFVSVYHCIKPPWVVSHAVDGVCLCSEYWGFGFWTVQLLIVARREGILFHWRIVLGGGGGEEYLWQSFEERGWLFCVHAGTDFLKLCRCVIFWDVTSLSCDRQETRVGSVTCTSAVSTGCDTWRVMCHVSCDVSCVTWRVVCQAGDVSQWGGVPHVSPMWRAHRLSLLVPLRCLLLHSAELPLRPSGHRLLRRLRLLLGCVMTRTVEPFHLL